MDEARRTKDKGARVRTESDAFSSHKKLEKPQTNKGVAL